MANQPVLRLHAALCGVFSLNPLFLPNHMHTQSVSVRIPNPQTDTEYVVTDFGTEKTQNKISANEWVKQVRC